MFDESSSIGKHRYFKGVKIFFLNQQEDHLVSLLPLPTTLSLTVKYTNGYF